MIWLDAYIEKCPGFAWKGAPTWNTKITPLRNKSTRRRARWSQPEWRFSVPLTTSQPAHYDQVIEMFMVCRGRAIYFRVRNWLRYKATAWRFATGDGSTTEFQLGKLHTVAGESVLEEFHALSLDPEAPAPQVFVDGSPVAAEFNDRTGRVQFAAAPADGAVLTWSGWFDYWVAFATDDLPGSIDTKAGDEFVVDMLVDLEQVPPPVEAFAP